MGKKATLLLAAVLILATSTNTWAGYYTLFASPLPSTPGTYTTTFPLTENPISESGNWIDGRTTGLDWGSIQTSGGAARATVQSVGCNGGTPPNTACNDSTAVLAGTWNANQTAEADVVVTNLGTNCCKEVELRLRTTITAHSITGYEIDCGIAPVSDYLAVVHWNGPLGSWVNMTPTTAGCHNGDRLKATVTGGNPTTITVFKNGTQVLQVLEGTGQVNPTTPWTSGSPGVGLFDSVDTNYSGFGFTSFTATSTNQAAPAPPTNLHTTAVQ